MPHRVERIVQSLRNTPLLIEQTELESILSYLEDRNNRKEFAILSQEEARERSRDSVSVENEIAILSIEGPLSYQYSWISALCGFTTYQGLLADFESAVEQGAKIVVLDTDSGGGQAYACFETANEMRKIADENGVKIITYVDGSAASAAYAIPSISDEIIANPMASVGSVGVVVSIKNQLPKEIKEGTEVLFVYAGDSKVPYDKEGKIKKESLDKIQEEVEELYGEFISHVALHRGMSEQAVRDTKALTFRTDKAIDLGLVDKSMTHSEFMDYLADLSEDLDRGEKRMPLMGRKRKKLQAEKPEENLEVLEEEQQTIEENSTMSDKIELTQEELEAKLAEARKEYETQTQSKLEALQAQLETLSKEKEQATLASYKEKLSEFSFVADEQKEALANFLLEKDGSDEASAVMSALESAQSTLEEFATEENGDQGTELDHSLEQQEKSAQKKAIEARYKTQ